MSQSQPDEQPSSVSLQRLAGVEVEVTIEIGRRRMKISDLMRLRVGQVLELPKAAGEPLDILVNGRLLGRGEAVVVGERYGVRVLEFVKDAQDVLP